MFSRLRNDLTTPSFVQKILIQQLAEFMVLVLVAAAVASAAVGEYKGAVTLAIVIVINTIIGFVQEYKAERALNSLMSLEVPRGSSLKS
jgi:P-type Ca2+ transporter type 2C